MRLIVLALFFSLFITIGIGQIINPNIVESTILIDGQFDEWGAYPEYQDNRNESESNDIIKVANGNDSTMIYFHIEVNTEFDLFDNNTLVLYLDGDGNPQTLLRRLALPSPGCPLSPAWVAAIADGALLLRLHRGATGSIT